RNCVAEPGQRPLCLFPYNSVDHLEQISLSELTTWQGAFRDGVGNHGFRSVRSYTDISNLNDCISPTFPKGAELLPLELRPMGTALCTATEHRTRIRKRGASNSN